ncbi:MAG: coenzyme F420-0:L-glutamate ligase [Sphaerimonospora mesophila]
MNTVKVEAIKTRTVRAGEITLPDLLVESIQELPEYSIVAISSKVVALCENRVVDSNSTTRADLVKQEADYYLPPEFLAYNYGFAIAQGTLIASAGIDESNGDGHWVLWPKDPFASANAARELLRDKFGRKHVGVIITDSNCLPPLRRGTIGIMVAWSGFQALNDLRGTPDLFQREFKVSVSAIAGGLAAAANVVMGEGAESTPITVISEVDFVKFTDHDPTPDEIAAAFVDKNEDLYAPFLNSVNWQRGAGGYGIISGMSR